MQIFIGLLSLLGAGLLGASADFGLRTKHSAAVTISRPPDAMLRGKEITIRPRAGVVFADRQSLELAIERGLASEFTASKDGRDLVLTYAVANFEPVTSKTFTQTEKRSVKVGKKMQKLPFSDKLVEVDDMQDRDVSVEYWEARGELGLQLTVNDSSGAMVDSFNAPSKYLRKVEIAVQGVSKTTESLPTPQSLQSSLIMKVAADIQQRYTKTNHRVDVRLTVDEPLRPGNAMAMSGQWKEALDSWSAVQMKKNPGDRLYNMAVAHESLAYQAYESTRNPDNVEGSFQQAIKLYAEALRSDSGEKFFRFAMDRCAEMQANFARAKEQYSTQQRVAEIEQERADARAKAEQELREKVKLEELELTSKRPDTQDEADFRTIARGRLKNASTEPAAGFQGKLVQLGKDGYKLPEMAARRVVHQEVEHLAKARTSLELYKQSFSDLVGADKTLDASDRTALKKLAQRLDLLPEELSPIEAQFDYRNLTTPPPAPAKPKVLAAKPAPAAKPMASKPEAVIAKPAKPAVPTPVPPLPAANKK